MEWQLEQTSKCFPGPTPSRFRNSDVRSRSQEGPEPVLAIAGAKTVDYGNQAGSDNGQPRLRVLGNVFHHTTGGSASRHAQAPETRNADGAATWKAKESRPNPPRCPPRGLSIRGRGLCASSRTRSVGLWVYRQAQARFTTLFRLIETRCLVMTLVSSPTLRMRWCHALWELGCVSAESRA